jgi:hypothetical protein
MSLTSEAENPQQPTKRANKKEKENKEKSNSLFNSIKSSLAGISSVEDQQRTEDEEKTPSEDKGNQSAINKNNKDYSQDSADKTFAGVSNKSENKKKTSTQNPEEDPAIHFINNLKDHERVLSVREKKDSIIKVAASVISIILIIMGIIYSFGRTQEVASNVIFGERAMFSVFLILVGFLILAAVFASRLLEGKFLKNIRHDLEMVEGKNQNNEKNPHPDPKKQSTNKKNK